MGKTSSILLALLLAGTVYGQVQKGADVSTLFSQLTQEDSTDEAAPSLAKLAAEDPSARAYLSQHLPELIATPGGEVKMNAIRLAGDLKLSSAVPALLPYLLRRDTVVGMVTFESWRRLDNDPAGSALAKIGEPSIGPVTQVLENGDSQARQRA